MDDVLLNICELLYQSLPQLYGYIVRGHKRLLVALLELY